MPPLGRFRLIHAQMLGRFPASDNIGDGPAGPASSAGVTARTPGPPLTWGAGRTISCRAEMRRRRMLWHVPLLRLLTVVASLAMAAVGMPAAASAHAGHSHAAPPAVATAHPVAVTAPAATEARKAAPAAHTEHRPDRPAGTRSLSEITAQPVAPGAVAPWSCQCSCCNSGAHACCGISLPAAVDLFPPPATRLPPHLTERGGPGIAPGALPKPPDALV